MKYGYTLTPSTLGTQSLRSAETQYVLAQREIQLSPSCPFHSQGEGRAWCDRVGRRKRAVLGSSGRQAPGRALVGWLARLSLLQPEPSGPLKPCPDHCCGPAAPL